jgi:hypothetical protein
VPAGIDLVAFEVPEGMVVSSITLAPAVERGDPYRLQPCQRVH